jgi:hypothetical protein
MLLFVWDENKQQFNNVFRKMVVMKEMDLEGFCI